MRRKIKEPCDACGNSVVNHRLFFVSNFIDDVAERVGLLNPPFLYGEKFQKLTNLFDSLFFGLLYRVGLVRYSGDIEKAKSGRSKLIWEEAQRRGIKMEQLIFFGMPMEYYRVKIKGETLYFQSLPVPPWLSQGGYVWADDKLTLAKKLCEAGIPSPKTKKVATMADARGALIELGAPLIVKPKNGSRGRHTTTNINTQEEMENAFHLARQITPVMVAQEHLLGSVYRATVVNNALVGFFRADPPRVVGDGLKSVRALILEKNKTKHERLNEIQESDDLVQFIARHGYNLGSIIPRGVALDLSAKTGRFYGGYTREMLPEVHPKMHTIFKRAGELVAAPVLGFDLIIGDPTKDPDTQRWGIIECNTLPFIDLHYFALEGEPINVAKQVWDLWET